MEQQLRGISSTYLKTRKKRSKSPKRSQLMREQSVRTQRHITLDEIGRRIALGQFKELNVKGDVDGSVALSDSFSKLSTEEIQINIIHKGVEQLQKLMLC
jgi:translation initiation factor IF-2